MAKTKQHLYIEHVLKTAKVEFVAEHKFSETRRFRFDYAIPAHKVAIEYEGIMSAKSRHTSVTGYTNDCEKYNHAQALGWRVIRLTALNVMTLEKILKDFVK